MQDVKRSTRRHFLAGTAAALAILPRDVAGQSLPHLTVGGAAIDSSSGLVSAARLGYFRQSGLDVDLVFNSGAANAAAVAGGSIQIASSNVITLIKAHLNGLPFQLIAPSSAYDVNHPTQVLVVRNDAQINKAADLNGKTIAVTSIGDLLSTATFAWIDKNGGNSSTVKLVEVPPSAETVALQTDRVQAASLAEPFLSEALATHTVRVFANIFEAIAPHFLSGAFFSTAEYINSHPDIITRFSRALIKGNTFANDHPDRTLPWMVEVAKMDPNIERHAQRERLGESLDPAQIQVEIDALAKQRLIDHAFDAREMISPVVLAGTRR